MSKEKDIKFIKKNYGCDLVLKNNQNVFFMLNEIIDVEFENI